MNNFNKMELMSKTDTIKLRNKHIGKNCQLFYRSDPLKIVRGQGQYMYDEEGTRYLDCINNVAHVGHCHPHVVAAGSKQMAELSTNNRFLHDELVRCAANLSKRLPGDLNVCFFVNSGSEANDLALRLARAHTKKHDVITLDHAYHGHLTAVMEISPYKFNQPGGEPKPDYVHVASCPDTYRGRFSTLTNPNDDLLNLYVNEVREIVDSLVANEQGIAAYIAESFQSCGGQIIPPDGYLNKVYGIVRDAGGVCIADEVQVGFGRIGTHYWAFEQQNVIPDIVTIAKPMGNGHPVGVVVTTPLIAQSFAASGISYFNTYGGNPVSCAIANAVMEVVDNEKLQENALFVGNYLLKQCNDLQKEFTLIGDVRGTGLFLGIELVTNRESRVPATKDAHYIVDRMKKVHHILVSSDGPNDNVIKLKPPMIFNNDNADQFLFGFRECLMILKQNSLDKLHVQSSCANESASEQQSGQNGESTTSKIQENQERLIKSV